MNPLHQFNLNDSFEVRVYVYQDKYRANLYIRGSNPLLFCSSDDYGSVDAAIQGLQAQMKSVFKNVYQVQMVFDLHQYNLCKEQA